MSLPLLVKKDGKLHFEEGNLVKTLDHNLIGDKPIAIVSVAGPSRMGKSFFLNLVHKYYRAKGWKNKNWLEDFDSSKDCTIKWRPGTKGHTQGIVMLETPLIVKRSNGSKIAVILLDTQGNFDNGSEKEESLAVFALSTLFSSLQIFNVSKLIQSVDMEYLEFFVEYTVKAKKNSKSMNKVGRSEEKSTKYFQDLAFLVRDWSNDHEHNYGDEGGEKYLMSIGENSEHYKSIKETFNRFCCYLMPEPDSKVRRPSPENPNLTMKDLGDDFTTHLKQVAKNLLHPDKVTTKEVRISFLVDFMKDYAKAVLDGNHLEFPTMMNLMAEHEIKKVVEHVSRDFEGNMTGVIADTDASSDVAWEKFEFSLNESIQQARKKYRDSIDFGSSTDGENQLEVYLGLSMDELQEKMQRKRFDCIKSSMKSWRDESITFLESNEKRHLYANPDQCDEILEECMNKSVKIHKRDSQAAFKEHEQYLEEVVRAHQERRKKLEAEHAQAMENAFQKFEENMTKVIADIDESKESAWESFDTTQENFFQKAVEEFLSSSPFGSNTDGENQMRDIQIRRMETYEKKMQQKRYHYVCLNMKSWRDESVNFLKSEENRHLFANPNQYEKILEECINKSVKIHERDSEATVQKHIQYLEKVSKAHQDRLQELKGEHAQAIENALRKFKENMTNAIMDIDESKESVWQDYNSLFDECIQEAVKASSRNSPFGSNTNSENNIMATLRFYRERYDEEMQRKRDDYIMSYMAAWRDEAIRSLKSLKKGYLYTNPSLCNKILDELEKKILKTVERDSNEAVEEQKRCCDEVKKVAQTTQQKANKRNKTVLKYVAAGTAVAAVTAAVPAAIGIVVTGVVATSLTVGGTAGALSFFGFMKNRLDNLRNNEEQTDAEVNSELCPSSTESSDDLETS